MTANDIRQSFLHYFSTHGHRIVPSAPLVPGDDPTLLFTNAGMNQFKDLFLGRERRDYRRATTSQKCMRVSGKHNDLDNVGPSLRHHTFFEMLGNFSFGDYFKTDAIPFAWTLLTDVWGLDPARLYPTIFRGETDIARDDEAYDIWRALVPADRITELGLAENFWQMGDTGPCGRCSEVHYFRGPDIPCEEAVCRGVECSCQRYVEIWNNVFMEFDRDIQGRLTPLPAPSIDTGMGLERITAVIQGKLSNYDTDLFTPILAAIGDIAGRTYTAATSDRLDHPDVSMRVVADHLRAMTFLIGDGVMPSNEWRGYVLRKIMRRAMRHGKKLGITEPFLHRLVDAVIIEMAGAYPDLRERREAIVRTIQSEEERFDAVLISGLPRLEDLLDRVASTGATSVPGEEVFRLYDSLGVPFDFVQDLAEQRGMSIDRERFDRAMEQQRTRARAGGTFKMGQTGLAVDPAAARALEIEDRFVREEERDCQARVMGLLHEDGSVTETLPSGARGFVVLDRTPFYVEAGGQVSDTGDLAWPGGGTAEVDGVLRASIRPRLHHVVVSGGTLRTGEDVRASIDTNRRDAIRRNHTATHLLHAALRQRFGTHVRQAGSLVSPDRLRFDFAHFQALSETDRREIERTVNAQIYQDTPVETAIKKTEDAIQSGAMALFGEKYGDTVRVVSVGDFSVELCGGTHVGAAGEIGPFILTEESGVAAGVRRIEAITGDAAVAHIQSQAAIIGATAAALGVPADHIGAAAAKLQTEVKRLARENTQLKMKLAIGREDAPEDDVLTIGDARFVARRVTGLDKDALRALSDSIRDRLKRGVVVLAAESDGRVQLLVSVTKELTDRIKAGQLVKSLAPLIGGGGGGRPDFAEAGGKDASGIDALLAEARVLVTRALQ